MFIAPIVYFTTLSPSTITTTAPIKVSQSSPYFLSLIPILISDFDSDSQILGIPINGGVESLLLVTDFGNI
ncbi:hypothetical protein Syun_021729 [Stephania yunnanensis]|uniref:Uncharacterized protein n=1 Tax=Stephania yunnanensis TaxID=152371 RepID=A0AAP0II29_9MAGN